MSSGNSVAVVTGGGSGLGREFALKLSEAGFKVAVIGRREEALSETVRLANAKGGTALAVSAGVSDEHSMALAFALTRSELGAPNLLVNCAGSIGPICPFGKASVSDWWNCFEVNVKGILVCSTEALKDMVPAGAGRIINVSSSAGLSARSLQSAYIASKSAVNRLTEAMAIDLSPSGVSVFSICPGFVRTEMTEGVAKQAGMENIKDALEKGADIPASVAADLVLEIASGKYDALSGKFIRAGVDNPSADVRKIKRRRIVKRAIKNPLSFFFIGELPPGLSRLR